MDMQGAMFCTQNIVSTNNNRCKGTNTTVNTSSGLKYQMMAAECDETRNVKQRPDHEGI